MYVNLNISFFDFLIVIVLFWAVYRGYIRGAIVHSVSLLVLLAGIVISAKIGYTISDYMQDRSRIPLYNLPLIIFGFLFIVAVLGAHFTTQKVIGNIGKEPKGTTNRVMGVLVSVVKYLYLISVVLIFVYKLDSNLNFVNQNEKTKTVFFYKVLSIAPTTFKILIFPEIYPVPIGKPEEIQKQRDLEEF